MMQKEPVAPKAPSYCKTARHESTYADKSLKTNAAGYLLYTRQRLTDMCFEFSRLNYSSASAPFSSSYALELFGNNIAPSK